MPGREYPAGHFYDGAYRAIKRFLLKFYARFFTFDLCF
jgi:hypothetical protein